MKRRGTCTFTVSVLHLHASPSCGRFRETATATPTASATVSPGFEEALGSDAGPRGLTHRTGAAWVQGRATRGSTEAPSSVCPQHRAHLPATSQSGGTVWSSHQQTSTWEDVWGPA